MSQIPTWQQPINAEAKKQLSKLFNQDAFNQIFKGEDHDKFSSSRKIKRSANIAKPS